MHHVDIIVFFARSYLGDSSWFGFVAALVLFFPSQRLWIAPRRMAELMSDVVYTNLVSTSCWHVGLDGLKFNGAAVKTMPRATVDSVSGSQLDPPWT